MSTSRLQRRALSSVAAATGEPGTAPTTARRWIGHRGDPAARIRCRRRWLHGVEPPPGYRLGERRAA